MSRTTHAQIILVVLSCCLAGHGWAELQNVEVGGGKSMRQASRVVMVDEAIETCRVHLDAHSEDLDALMMLARVHLLAAELGRDAVNLRQPRSTDELPQLEDAGLPFYRRAVPQRLLSPNRLRHLADSIRMLRRAHEVEPESPLVGLYLGYALLACRERFEKNPWPFRGTDFDDRVREAGDQKNFWVEEALPHLRVAVADLNEPTAEPFEYQNKSDAYAAYLLVGILDGGRSLTEEERLTLDHLRPVAEGWEKQNRHLIPMGARPLPPQPPKLAARYPATAAGLATAELYFQALDAAIPYATEFDRLPIIGTEAQYTGRSEGLMSEEQHATTARFLQSHQESYRLIELAVNKGECRFPIDMSKGAEIDLAHLAPMRQIARMLALKALYEAETGQGDQAIDTLVQGMGVSVALRDEPFLISQLVRIALQGIVIGELEHVMQRTEISAAAGRRMRAALEVDPPGELWATGIMGESLMHSPGPGMPAWTAEQKQEFEQMHKRFEAAARLPYSEAVAEIEQAIAIAPSVMPALGRAHTAAYRGAAQARAAQVALAVDRYWIDRGAPPANLEDLVPAYLSSVVLDPFTNTAILLRIDSEGFVAYSVGDNLKDDHGTRGDNRPPLDIIFTVGTLTAPESDQTLDGIVP